MKCYPVVATVLLLAATRPAAEPFSPTCIETAGYAVSKRPYMAVRRLEAENGKTGKEAWMDARTTLGADGRLAVEILDEGGSEQIRNRVFRAALEREQELVASRSSATTAPLDTYECAEPELDASGLLRVPLRPRRKDVNLVFGDLFMQPSTGDVVRVAGRLAKSPSFWVSQVDVEWRYERVHNDIVLPVSLYSNAKVKIFGPSTFRMTYDYVSVDGQPVAVATRASR
jgi:hypothetical protein